MNRTIRTKKLSEVIKKRQKVKGFIQSRRLKSTKHRFHDVISSCGCIINKKLKRK